MENRAYFRLYEFEKTRQKALEWLCYTTSSQIAFALFSKSCLFSTKSHRQPQLLVAFVYGTARADTLRALAEKSPSSELRFATAMQEIDYAAVDLYMLWAEPYLWIGDPDAARHNFHALRRKEAVGPCSGRET